MQHSVISLLIVVLGASVAAFCAMGLRQRTRRLALAAAAAEMHLEFNSADLNDLPLRYADLALIGSGHSRRADNITTGRIGRWHVRVFDFRYEAGHGVGRLTQHYSAAVVDLADPMDSLLLWHKGDIKNAPLEARFGDGDAGAWTYLGSEAVAHRLAHACAPLSDLAVSAQVERDVLLLCCPAGRGTKAYIQLMTSLGDVLAALAGHAPTATPRTN